jgi:hypothetical protein
MLKFNSFIMVSGLMLTVSMASAQETLFKTYEKTANDLVVLIQSDAPTLPVAQIKERNSELLFLGIQIMDLYGSTYTQCQAQYADLKTKLSKMESLSSDEIHDFYHDGKDLPQAPSYCYIGRSLVVHPAMSAARLRDGQISLDDKEIIEEETREVAEHVVSVAKKLEN